jgi:malonyl-CoA/methylmalonyl-CoA synthetase
MVCSVRHDGDRRAGYVGLPLDGVDVRLVDESGATIDTSDDETLGEVAVRGPNLFDGYLNRPDATAEVIKDGWFMTGDIATRAPDGYIRIAGRRSTDMIKTGGYRVGAGEVEAALLEHPDIAEAAVLGRPDDDLGERIVAWIVPRDGATVDEDEVIDHMRRLLSVHKRPRELRVVDALPRNALGKVQKKLLS